MPLDARASIGITTGRHEVGTVLPTGLAASRLPVPDKESRACGSALETGATARAGLDRPFASVALVGRARTAVAG